MFALLRNIGFSSIIKVISFIGIAFFAWWSDNKAENALAEKELLASNLAVLKSTNLNNAETIASLQKWIKQQEALIIKRNELVDTITRNTVDEKAQLNKSIKESTDEQTINWADQPVPDVVIGLLKLKPP